MKILFWGIILFVFTCIILPSSVQIYYFFEGSKHLQWNHLSFSIVCLFVGGYIIHLVYKKFKKFVKYYEQNIPEDFN